MGFISDHPDICFYLLLFLTIVNIVSVVISSIIYFKYSDSIKKLEQKVNEIQK